MPSIPKLKPANCSKPPAASASKWWRNNALLLFDLRNRRAGCVVDCRQAGRSLAQSAHSDFPGHETAAQAAPADAERLFPRRPEFASAAGRHDCSELADDGGGQGNIFV